MGNLDHSTSIMDLPDDCLLHVFNSFEGLQNRDRESFGLTCRRWLQIQNIGRKSLHIHSSFTLLRFQAKTDDDPSFELLRKLLKRFRCLNSLCLSSSTELEDSYLTQLEFLGSPLKTLKLDCCFKITDKGLSFVAAQCASLTRVGLSHSKITDVGLETLAKSCRSLQVVNLSYCAVTDIGIGSLMKECRQLRHVMITYCKGITGTGFRGCSATLSIIEADSCMLEPEGISEIVSGGGLEYLDVSSLSWCRLGDGLGGIGSGFASRLRVLNLRMCHLATNESIIAIAKHCPALQEWSLARCRGISLSGWKAIALHCHKLEVLHVSHCRGFRDDGLQAIREGCKQLSILYMLRCSHVSSLALELFKLHRQKVQIKEEDSLCKLPRH
ncbi:hypothetical protein Syun_006001 [Stephania yunnanensis]|uniref:F-box/LRR-repeat protein 15-like leucin rich repeat domain-containing protein n=1 Tax=Stephania yunnanensis TaxID=152371 RepID=A0AAP0KYD5_9MAGN